jgi:hypothetical protein
MLPTKFRFYFFLGWNYMCLGIEPLFDLSIFTAVDKVKDRILYNKVWKDGKKHKQNG